MRFAKSNLEDYIVLLIDTIREELIFFLMEFASLEKSFSRSNCSVVETFALLFLFPFQRTHFVSDYDVITKVRRVDFSRGVVHTDTIAGSINNGVLCRNRVENGGFTFDNEDPRSFPLVFRNNWYFTLPWFSDEKDADLSRRNEIPFLSVSLVDERNSVRRWRAFQSIQGVA